MDRAAAAYDDAGGQAMQRPFAALVFVFLRWALFLVQQNVSIELERHAAGFPARDPVLREIADLWLAGP